MKNLILTTIALITLLASQITMAQDNWGLELRNGASFATKELGDATLKTGFGFEGTINYRFMPHLSAYAGWGWNRFSADNSFAGTNMDFEETGYTFGFQFIHPIEETSLSYLIRVGGIFNHIEVENGSGEIISDSKHGLGWEIGAGIVIPIFNRLNLLPSVRYRSLSRDIEIGNRITSVSQNYVSAGVG
ncbi:MAG TPA: outer membrane beta-barrel protein, partial [Ignavibacteriaceae bacterium]|nr:outer membrane beta-barrel protein [Ignavibacteriaceae bacterium]